MYVFERWKGTTMSAAFAVWKEELEARCGLRAHAVPEEYVQRVIEIAIRTNSLAGEIASEQSRLIEGLRHK